MELSKQKLKNNRTSGKDKLTKQSPTPKTFMNKEPSTFYDALYRSMADHYERTVFQKDYKPTNWGLVIASFVGVALFLLMFIGACYYHAN